MGAASNVPSSITILPSTLDLGETWVHFQDPRETPISFSISIPSEHVEQVFGPAANAEPLSLCQYIRHNIDTLGTFIAEGYIKEIRKLLGVQRKPYARVIIAIDTVTESEGTITLTGRTVKFDSSKYV